MRYQNKMAAESVFAGPPTSGNRSVTVPSVGNSTILPAYSNVRPEMNQISHLQFYICVYSPVLYIARTRKTGVPCT